VANLLIRGVPERIHREVERLAEAGNLSVNQMLIQLIKEAVQYEEEKKESQKRREEAFNRLEAIRKEISKKYGRQEESWKLIREFRDRE